MQKAVLIIGALLLLFATFYVGKKFDYWKYRFLSRNKPVLPGAVTDRYLAVTPGDLVEQSLAAERAGKWKEAVELLVAAKHKDLRYRGLLFRCGRLAYEHGDFDSADKFFDRAIAFGENIPSANHYRGLIALQRHDYVGAEHFFENAANDDPFTPHHHYFWGEALRLDHHPTEAIPRYGQAAARAGDPLEETICRFKTRMAELEAGGAAKVAREIEEKRASGPLPVDWLMTAAALNIREAQIGEALRLLSNARAGNNPGLFASCVKDLFFVDACKNDQQLAEACRLEFDFRPAFR